MAAMAKPKATSIVLVMVLVLATVSLIAGTNGYATYYTPSYLRTSSLPIKLLLRSSISQLINLVITNITYSSSLA